MDVDDAETRTHSALETLFYHTDRIRFLYWDRLSGAKTAVALTGLVAVTVFITGLSHLSRDDITFDGPLSLPFLEGYIPVGGVAIAFVLFGLTYALNRQRAIAWYGAMVVVPLAAAVPLATLHSVDLPLLLLVLLTVPKLARNRAHFDRQLDLSPIQIAALGAIVGVLAYGTIGAYLTREQFANLETWGDAVYFVITTIATVGYGDISPVTTQARWFSISLILFGTGAFTAAIGTFIVPAIQKRMAAAVGTMSPDLTLLEDHVLVLGYGELTNALMDTIPDDVKVVVVTPETETTALLNEEDVKVVSGDPADTETLLAASIGSARGVVVATADDARDVLSIIAVRQLVPDIPVVAAANEQQHVDKLEAVGADRVISPAVIAGKLLGEAVLERSEEPTDSSRATEQSADNSRTNKQPADGSQTTEQQAE